MPYTVSYIDVEYPALPHFRQEHATWTWNGRKWKPVVTTLVIPEMFSTLDEQAALDAVPSGTTFEITVVHSKTWGTGAMMTQPGKPCHTPASVRGLSRSRNPSMSQSCSLGHSMNTPNRRWVETFTIPTTNGDVDVKVQRAEVTLDNLQDVVMRVFDKKGEKHILKVPPRRADQLALDAPDPNMGVYVPVDPAVREDQARKLLTKLFSETWNLAQEGHPIPAGVDLTKYTFGLHLTIQAPNQQTGVMEDYDAMWCTPFPLRFRVMFLATQAVNVAYSV